MKAVLSVGGSLVHKEKLQVEYMKKLAALFESLQSECELGITVGGGYVCREYVDIARKFGEDEQELHLLGIALTRANALLFKGALKDAEFFDTIDKAAIYMEQGRGIPVLGGTVPGHTTDAVAAQLAERIGADRWINLSNVAGVYDKDPNKSKDAKFIKEMTHKQLLDLIEPGVTPSQNVIIDSVALDTIARANIDAHFVDGTDFDSVKNSILGKPHKGTVVKD